MTISKTHTPPDNLKGLLDDFLMAVYLQKSEEIEYFTEKLAEQKNDITVEISRLQDQLNSIEGAFKQAQSIATHSPEIQERMQLLLQKDIFMEVEEDLQKNKS